MKTHWLPLAALSLILPSALGAQQPAPSQSGAERIREAERALASVDEPRVLRDAEYAGAMADHLLVLQAGPGLSESRRSWLERVIVYALAAAGRHDRAQAAADALLRSQAGDQRSYELALFAARRAARWERTAELVQRALRLPTEMGAALLSPPTVGSLLRDMRAAGALAARARTAEALVAAGWPGDSEPPSASDWLRQILIDRELERGDVAAARRLASEVQGLWTVLELVTDRRYDPVVADSDRLAAVRAAIERQDRFTAERLAAAPDDTERLVDRAGFLRSIGRDREVLDLLLPLMGEVRLVAGRHRRGLWLVNEAAYSLIATGAAGEAAELMRPLFDLNIDANPELVNTSINFVSILWQAGQSEEALRRADAFMAGGARHASDYGKMWIIANAVCAATDLRRTADAEAWLARTSGIASSNHSAMLQALLCRNDLAGAERVLLAALEDDTHRNSAILWLQDYDRQPQAGRAERVRESFRRLGSRAAVEAALARVGHRLRLPLPPSRYGWY